MQKHLGHNSPLGAFQNWGGWLQRRSLGASSLSILSLKTFYPSGFPTLTADSEPSNGELLNRAPSTTELDSKASHRGISPAASGLGSQSTQEQFDQGQTHKNQINTGQTHKNQINIGQIDEGQPHSFRASLQRYFIPDSNTPDVDTLKASAIESSTLGLSASNDNISNGKTSNGNIPEGDVPGISSSALDTPENGTLISRSEAAAGTYETTLSSAESDINLSETLPGNDLPSVRPSAPALQQTSQTSSMSVPGLTDTASTDTASTGPAEANITSNIKETSISSLSESSLSENFDKLQRATTEAANADASHEVTHSTEPVPTETASAGPASAGLTSPNITSNIKDTSVSSSLIEKSDKLQRVATEADHTKAVAGAANTEAASEVTPLAETVSAETALASLSESFDQLQRATAANVEANNTPQPSISQPLIAQPNSSEINQTENSFPIANTSQSLQSLQSAAVPSLDTPASETQSRPQSPTLQRSANERTTDNSTSDDSEAELSNQKREPIEPASAAIPPQGSENEPKAIQAPPVGLNTIDISQSIQSLRAPGVPALEKNFQPTDASSVQRATGYEPTEQAPTIAQPQETGNELPTSDAILAQRISEGLPPETTISSPSFLQRSAEIPDADNDTATSADTAEAVSNIQRFPAKQSQTASTVDAAGGDESFRANQVSNEIRTPDCSPESTHPKISQEQPLSDTVQLKQTSSLGESTPLVQPAVNIQSAVPSLGESAPSVQPAVNTQSGASDSDVPEPTQNTRTAQDVNDSGLGSPPSVLKSTLTSTEAVQRATDLTQPDTSAAPALEQKDTFQQSVISSEATSNQELALPSSSLASSESIQRADDLSQSSLASSSPESIQRADDLPQPDTSTASTPEQPNTFQQTAIQPVFHSNNRGVSPVSPVSASSADTLQPQPISERAAEVIASGETIARDEGLANEPTISSASRIPETAADRSAEVSPIASGQVPSVQPSLESPIQSGSIQSGFKPSEPQKLLRDNLSHADLSGASPAESAVSEAVLPEVNVSRVNLSRMNLTETAASEVAASEVAASQIGSSETASSRANLPEVNLSETVPSGTELQPHPKSNSPSELSIQRTVANASAANKLVVDKPVSHESNKSVADASVAHAPAASEAATEAPSSFIPAANSHQPSNTSDINSVQRTDVPINAIVDPVSLANPSENLSASPDNALSPPSTEPGPESDLTPQSGISFSPIQRVTDSNPLPADKPQPAITQPSDFGTADATLQHQSEDDQSHLSSDFDSADTTLQRQDEGHQSYPSSDFDLADTTLQRQSEDDQSYLSSDFDLADTVLQRQSEDDQSYPSESVVDIAADIAANIAGDIAPNSDSEPVGTIQAAVRLPQPSTSAALVPDRTETAQPSSTQLESDLNRNLAIPLTGSSAETQLFDSALPKATADTTEIQRWVDNSSAPPVHDGNEEPAGSPHIFQLPPQLSTEATDQPTINKPTVSLSENLDGYTTLSQTVSGQSAPIQRALESPEAKSQSPESVSGSFQSLEPDPLSKLDRLSKTDPLSKPEDKVSSTAEEKLQRSLESNRQQDELPASTETAIEPTIPGKATFSQAIPSQISPNLPEQAISQEAPVSQTLLNRAASNKTISRTVSEPAGNNPNAVEDDSDRLQLPTVLQPLGVLRPLSSTPSPSTNPDTDQHQTGQPQAIQPQAIQPQAVQRQAIQPQTAQRQAEGEDNSTATDPVKNITNTSLQRQNTGESISSEPSPPAAGQRGSAPVGDSPQLPTALQSPHPDIAQRQIAQPSTVQPPAVQLQTDYPPAVQLQTDQSWSEGKEISSEGSNLESLVADLAQAGQGSANIQRQIAETDMPNNAGNDNAGNGTVHASERSPRLRHPPYLTPLAHARRALGGQGGSRPESDTRQTTDESISSEPTPPAVVQRVSDPVRDSLQLPTVLQPLGVLRPLPSLELSPKHSSSSVSEDTEIQRSQSTPQPVSEDAEIQRSQLPSPSNPDTPKPASPPSQSLSPDPAQPPTAQSQTAQSQTAQPQAVQPHQPVQRQTDDRTIPDQWSNLESLVADLSHHPHQPVQRQTESGTIPNEWSNLESLVADLTHAKQGNANLQPQPAATDTTSGAGKDADKVTTNNTVNPTIQRQNTDDDISTHPLTPSPLHPFTPSPPHPLTPSPAQPTTPTALPIATIQRRGASPAPASKPVLIQAYRDAPTVTLTSESDTEQDDIQHYSQYLELLAQEVYSLLRQRLSLEQERRGPKYPR